MFLVPPGLQVTLWHEGAIGDTGGHGPAGKRPQSSPGFHRQLVRAKFISTALRDTRQLRHPVPSPPGFICAGDGKFGWEGFAPDTDTLRSKCVSRG